MAWPGIADDPAAPGDLRYTVGARALGVDDDPGLFVNETVCIVSDRASGYVDRILKGEKPADLPIQAPTKFARRRRGRSRHGRSRVSMCGASGYLRRNHCLRFRGLYRSCMSVVGMGLMILGTAGTPKGLEIAKREGAHQVFDHRKAGYQEEILKETGNRGVDIILETLANVNLSHDTKLLAKDGRVIVIGNRGEVTINPRELMMRRASIRAFTLWDITPAEEADIHARTHCWARKWPLRPVVGKELPLAEAARAHQERSLNPEPVARSCSSADKRRSRSAPRKDIKVRAD